MNLEEYKKIISHAVNAEIEAYTFYRDVAERARDAATKRLFHDLAEEEANHRKTLEGFLKRTPEKMRFSESADYKIADGLPTPPLTPDLKPVDGIIYAIKKELEAMQLYTRLANASTEEEQKNVFLELVSMERSHKTKLEDIYTNMAFPEAW
jgi:rubrerythrin